MMLNCSFLGDLMGFNRGSRVMFFLDFRGVKWCKMMLNRVILWDV